ncbi:phosphoribosylformylglycinamidine synthase, partial [Streptococcus danieliae]|nr:phosphoribosylformylglycinamidine synthase [Streptococcus danieliae]
DSMSGTFEDLTVPPTFISFALTTGKVQGVTSPEFKKENSYVYLLEHKEEADFRPNYAQLRENFDLIEKLREEGKLSAIASVRQGGLLETFATMSFGNKIGLEVTNKEVLAKLNKPSYGSFLVETSEELEDERLVLVGKTVADKIILDGEVVELDSLIKAWQEPLEKVYPSIYKHDE